MWLLSSAILILTLCINNGSLFTFGHPGRAFDIIILTGRHTLPVRNLNPGLLSLEESALLSELANEARLNRIQSDNQTRNNMGYQARCKSENQTTIRFMSKWLDYCLSDMANVMQIYILMDMHPYVNNLAFCEKPASNTFYLL